MNSYHHDLWFYFVFVSIQHGVYLATLLHQVPRQILAVNLSMTGKLVFKFFLFNLQDLSACAVLAHKSIFHFCLA